MIDTRYRYIGSPKPAFGGNGVTMANETKMTRECRYCGDRFQVPFQTKESVCAAPACRNNQDEDRQARAQIKMARNSSRMSKERVEARRKAGLE